MNLGVMLAVKAQVQQKLKIMFGDGPLTFREFATHEPLPLATVHDALLEFLEGREDAVLLGAHAVNAYVAESRMTQDVDLAATRASEVADEVRGFLETRFQLALRICSLRTGGFRIDQVREPGNRHLVDVRQVATLPLAQRIRNVLVAIPPELIASKVVCMVARCLTPRGYQDRADLYRLLLSFPELKAEAGLVTERLCVAGATIEVLNAWKELIAQDIRPEEEDDKFGY